MNEDNPLLVEEPEVWYKLMEAGNNTPFAGTSVDSVSLTEDNTVKDMRNAVFAACQAILPGRVPSQLVLFKDQTAYNSSEPLAVESRLKSLGQTKETTVIVTVPVTTVRTRSREEPKDEVDEAPAKRRKASASSSKWQWKDEEEEPVYSVEGGKLFFMSQDRPTLELLESYHGNYNCAKRGEGNVVIPLIDHIPGLGKSTFSQEFIRTCRQRMDRFADASIMQSSFMDTVRQCHTITIEFFGMDLLNDDLSLTVERPRRFLSENSKSTSLVAARSTIAGCLVL